VCLDSVTDTHEKVKEKPMFNPDFVQVVGVSPDPVEKQKEFVTKHNLNVRVFFFGGAQERVFGGACSHPCLQYPVLSDEKGGVRAAYKVGKGLMGLNEAARVTFVIDGQGIVRCVPLFLVRPPNPRSSDRVILSDELHSTLSPSAHSKFVEKWLKTLSVESKAVPSKGEPGEATSAETQKASA
jgi:peroxiredoxin Q/BCP